MTDDSAIQAALGVMQAHITAINARDEPALAATLHFPHYRLSGTGMKVWDTPDTYFADFRSRAGDGWARSSFENTEVVQCAADKAHLSTEIRRYRADGSVYQSFRSLWVITYDGGRWAARLRSSFAPQ